LGKDPYQGIASAMPPKVTILNGFKPPGLASHGTAAKACALYLLLAACLKACPDTSLASNCVTQGSAMVPFACEGRNDAQDPSLRLKNGCAQDDART
jgi:hypothetical protein